MSKVNLITQAEYAKRRGVSEAAVSKAIKAGRISLIDGRIDPVAADAQWARNSRVRIGGGKAPAAPAKPPAGSDGRPGDDSENPGGGDYWDSRSRRERAESEKAEIELAKLKEQVILVHVVEAVWSQACGNAREHLLQIRARLAPLLAAESDPLKVEKMLDDEHIQALNKMAGVVLRKGAAT